MGKNYSRDEAKNALVTFWHFSPVEAETLVSRADQWANRPKSARHVQRPSADAHKPGYRTARVTRLADGTYTVEEGN